LIEEKCNKLIMKEGIKLPSELLIMPLRNSVFFPSAIMPLTIGRTKTVQLIEEVAINKSLFGVVAQKRSEINDPRFNDIYGTGTLARIIKLYKFENERFNLIVEGISRLKITKFIKENPYIVGNTVSLFDEFEATMELETLVVNLKNAAREVIDLLPEIPIMAKQLLDSVSSPGHLADLITANIDATIEEKQDVLESIQLNKRLIKVIKLLNRQLGVLKLSNRINAQVKGEMSKTQREYYLRQQLKAIKEELDDGDDEDYGIDEIESKIKSTKMTNDAHGVALRELKRIKNMQSSQAEYTVSRTYLDWLADLPWGKYTNDNLNLKKVRFFLDSDHFGLDMVKKRIIEYLAVKKLKKEIKGPILCFLGPPGIGKTSLGKSIAGALNRKFYRMSLGGIRDEAEIRGHRRTYIGALPGRIIQGIKKSGSQNPIFLLDEIDKLENDFRGDPSSALLEVLDPEQNNSFNDHYLDVDFDLSNVIFIATANRLETIPAPLRDRMETISLPGYTFEEKKNIAKKYLIPKQIKEHGLGNIDIDISEEIILKIIESYTRESGVRGLEREISSICRNIAVDISNEIDKGGIFKKNIITNEKLLKILGPEKFYNDEIERKLIPGVSIGLAWTEVGGDIIFIEGSKMPGSGVIVMTGQIGSVMKESAQTALSWIKSNAVKLKLSLKQNSNFLNKTDVHLHFPAGAIPKDGPSAGVAIAVSLVSLLRNKKVKFDIAVTGEITLRGNVLPVGGIKEKVIAAHRAGIKKVGIPMKNKRDLIDVSEKIKKDIDFFFAKKIEDILVEVF
jgi:ATP-dependent Lon protease